MSPALRQSLPPIAVATVAATAVIFLWQGLRYDHETKVAQVTEAASYATRSALARQLIEQFGAFRDLADFWAANEGGQTGQATAANAIPLTLFEGVDVLTWDEQGPHFVSEDADLEVENLSDARQWSSLGKLFPVQRPTRPTIIGPEIDSDGHAIYSFLVPARREATLIGVIDANDALETFLLDEAPGYDIHVRCCDGLTLYRRSTETFDPPDRWIVDGWISPEPGLLWNVEHRPTPDLATGLTPWATDAVLIVGLAMAFALGAFVHQSQRADNRARAASEAEQHVTTLNRNLEHEVERRTQDLNEVLADLNTINLSVSHDLRSPLNAISLLSHQLRLQRDRSPEDQALLERIEANVKRSGAIMDRLFGFSRATSFEYTIEPVDMQALADQVAEELGSDHPSAEISIGMLPPTEADGTMVHSLLTNLVANALKYACDQPSIRIEIGHEFRDGESVYFVRDNGPGFEPALTGQLFKPLKRPSEGGKKGGLGLGLTIAARIAKRHGGRIWAESKPGEGATVKFTLAPRAR